MILIPQFRNIIECGGTLQIVHTGPNGELIEERMYSNIVTTIGKQWIAARMKTTDIPNEMKYMAVGGNGTVGSNPTKTTPSIAEQVLSTGGTPSLSELARTQLSTVGGTVSGAVVTYAATFNAGTGTGSLVEAGIFNVLSGPTQGTGSISSAMLCKTSFDVVNKAANDSIAITWTVTIQ